ncbi:hypothetical protein RHMOL_RhmolMtG0003200 (mitochondrion) [Rhododendron molle]|nr:hypothetical protein RHMOL_RhmolMtG0003200 [Rhododendron molle]
MITLGASSSDSDEEMPRMSFQKTNVFGESSSEFEEDVTTSSPQSPKQEIFSNEYDKAPNSKYSVRGTELLFPGTILRLKTFFFSRNLRRSATKFQTSKPDVKPFSMSSTRPVDPGGKGNPLIESNPIQHRRVEFTHPVARGR